MSAPRIRVLPEDLVNQIAAGEVVENPASVVKELVENAVDAGASRITIEVDSGGLSLIRVADNGHGMTPEEARLAIERHATSKIGSLEDLSAIRTLGFRGEALPAIASVSRFALKTRANDAEAGTSVEVSGSDVRVRPCACAVGTTVTVQDLFYNVPARMKFQKAERSRVAAIRDYLGRAALAWPGVHLSLFVGGRRSLDFPACSDPLDRVVQVFGAEEADAARFEAERDAVRVLGVLGNPARARQDPSRIVLLVNGRPIFDPALRRAILTAYSVLVPEGRFPLAVVWLAMDPASVDVNVHPRKTEVRFRDPRAVQSAVFEAVREAVAQTPWVQTAERDRTGSGWPAAADARVEDGLRESPQAFGAPVGVREPHAAREDRDSQVAVVEPALGPDFARAGRFSGLRYVGQVARTVLVCEGPNTVVFLDQHAVHERIQYETLWTALRSGAAPSDSLLIPEVVQFSAMESSRLESVIPLLADLGFDIEPYSGDSAVVRAVPSILRGRAAGPVVRDCVAAATPEADRDGADRMRKIVATVACHAAIRAGDPLDEAQVRALLNAMDRVDLASYCPHGRQAVVVYPLDTVLRWFGR